MDTLEKQLKKLEGYLQAIEEATAKGKIRYWIISWNQFQTDLPMILVTEALYQQLAKVYFRHFELKGLWVLLSSLNPVLHKNFHSTPIASLDEFCDLLGDYKKNSDLWTSMQFSINEGLLNYAASLLNLEIQPSQNQ